MTEKHHYVLFSVAEVKKLAADLAERDAEIAALRAAREWRPIESAPRDGTRVLLWIAVSGTAPWAETAEFDGDEWWRNDGDEICGENSPTHWQPVPPAPKDPAT